MLFRAYSKLKRDDALTAQAFYQEFQVEIEECRQYIMTPGILEKVIEDIGQEVREYQAQVLFEKADK